MREWLTDFLSRWWIPREDYDERLECLRQIDYENARLRNILHDYVELQVLAPFNNLTKLDKILDRLEYYRKGLSMPPLREEPSVVDIETSSYEIVQSRVLCLRVEMRIDTRTLLHLQRFAISHARYTLAQKLVEYITCF